MPIEAVATTAAGIPGRLVLPVTIMSHQLIDALDAHQGYPRGLGELGDPWDTTVRAAVRAFAQVDADKRSKARDALTLDRSWVLQGWAERMATLAVRRNDPGLVVDAMVAVSLAAGETYRDAEVVLAVLAVAARHLGEDAVALAAAAAEETDGIGREWLLMKEALRVPRLPSTHVQRGSGPEFEFARVPTPR